MVVLDTVPDAAAWWCAVTQRWIQRVCREKDFRQPLQEYAVERARLQMVHLPERHQGRTTQVSTATPPHSHTAAGEHSHTTEHSHTAAGEHSHTTEHSHTAAGRY